MFFYSLFSRACPCADAWVGAFRTTHALRYYTSFRTGLTPLLHAPHAANGYMREACGGQAVRLGA
ncbi:MAG: hypothetical protein NZ455_09255 [Bacteroidia bacterium]|nr:hypothetical protein [Bacteroidia bacterium]MDW8346207.1 hypothetical protein [Bacteroidia bacterium]